MKGVNLKRIGAIVAGATILASSVAFAGAVYYSDTVLVTDSGQPVVKVVVGADAAASDGVAAANIAAHLAHEAYKTDTYTAMVGDVACEASGSDGGDCVITDKSVTLEVTVPGATVTGSYTMNTLVGDYIDKTLTDRHQATDRTYPFTVAETSVNANPLDNGQSTFFSNGPGNVISLYKIGGSDFSPMADYTVQDEDASTSYSETQAFWVGDGTTTGGHVVYSDSANDLELKLPKLIYSIKFADSNDMGIPYCTQATNATLYHTCDDTYQTPTHKVKIMFLGEEWIISEMSLPTTSTPSELYVTQGGYIKLAKESVDDILNKGEYLTVGDLKFVLDDVALATGSTNVHAAILSVYAEGVEEPLKSVQINPGSTQDVSVTGYGTYKVHVYKTAPGYTFGATWADVAIFSDELKLQHNSDLDPDVGANEYWKVLLGWKNRGASATDTNPDHLRTVIIYSDEVSDQLIPSSQWTPGLSAPVVQDPANWQLTFSGLNIDDSDRSPLSFTMERQTQKEISINATAKCNISAPYVKISVPSDYKMTLSTTQALAQATEAPATGTDTAGYHYEAYMGARAGNSSIVCDSGRNYVAGSVAMKTGTSSTSYYVIANNSDDVHNVGVVDILWDHMGAGTSWANGGVIRVGGRNQSSANATFYTVDFSGETAKLFLPIGVSEETGTGESTNMQAQYVFGINYSGTNGATSTFNFDGSTTGTTYFYKDHVYAIIAGPYGSNGTVEEGYITERGSKFVSMDDTSVKFKIADELAYAQVTLATSESAASEPNTVTLTDMEEGDEETVSGTDVKVKVVEIKATGSCDTGAGATPSCTVSGDATAYLEDEDGANVGSTLEAATMYTGSMDLVVLDSDVTAGTVISVGGPAVNTVTEAAQSEGDFALEAAEDIVVTQVGNTIVVAGYSAGDTLDAAEQFLAALE